MTRAPSVERVLADHAGVRKRPRRLLGGTRSMFDPDRLLVRHGRLIHGAQSAVTRPSVYELSFDPRNATYTVVVLTRDGGTWAENAALCRSFTAWPTGSVEQCIRERRAALIYLQSLGARIKARELTTE